MKVAIAAPSVQAGFDVLCPAVAGDRIASAGAGAPA